MHKITIIKLEVTMTVVEAPVIRKMNHMKDGTPPDMLQSTTVVKP
jgi:hypothetical protein